MNSDSDRLVPPQLPVFPLDGDKERHLNPVTNRQWKTCGDNGCSTLSQSGVTPVREWEPILEFWFPEGTKLDVDARVHHEYWMWRMRGGADGEIIARFADTTEKAVRGAFDGWADDPHGRLALIIALDQFPRSLWRDSPRAFAQDERALALALEGFENGHYAALETPWYKTVYNLPLGHCEGADHLERLDRAIALAQEILLEAPAHLQPGYEFAAEQPVEVRKVILAFGRHPHRNAILGRTSTPEEEAYLAQGLFPHLRTPKTIV